MKSQPDADLLPVQNTNILLLATSREGGQMLTYLLFKTQSILLSASRQGHLDADLQAVQNPSTLLSATSRKGQPDSDILPVQDQSMLLSATNREPFLMLTYILFKTQCQQQVGKASQMLTYILSKTKSSYQL
jgi:hypothetical protein